MEKGTLPERSPLLFLYHQQYQKGEKVFKYLFYNLLFIAL